MKKIEDEKPTTHMFPSGPDATTNNKKSYLNQISSLVVDMFVVDQKRNKDVELSVWLMKTQEQVQQPDVFGRFPCKFPVCPKSFALHGKLKKDHEAKHNPPVPVTSTEYTHP